MPIIAEYRYDCIASNQPIHHCISGTVTDCCDMPLGGVCVKIITGEYEPVTHTLTDTCGTFTLIWKTDAMIQLIFAKEGYATLQLERFDDPLLICLKREDLRCMVSGTVLYKHGAPAASVKVQLLSSHVNLCVFSKADGRFLFTRVPDGKYTLTITGNDCKKRCGCVTVSQHSPSCSIGTIYVEQVNILCTVHGLITDRDGLPIPNAVVVLISCSIKEPVSHTLSNEHGLYFFGAVRNGSYYVEAFY